MAYDLSKLFSGGVSTPFAADATGSLRLLYGDEYVKKTLEILTSDCDSENPFQRGLGIALDDIFQVQNDPRWQGATRALIQKLFDKYLEPANLARLIKIEFLTAKLLAERTGGVTNNVTNFEGVEGQLYCNITFLSIESNTKQQVTMGQSTSNTSAAGLFRLTTGGL